MIRAATSARGGTAPTSTDPGASLAENGILDQLRDGALELIGRLVGSSNNAMVVRVNAPRAPAARGAARGRRPVSAGDLLAVWKPTRGERPLFDFPVGTLTRREVAAYLASEATGWGIVPPTVLREGPFGEGSLQQWIEVDPAADPVGLLDSDDARLRRVAVFDAIVNNTDRKLGHLLPVPGGHLYAVDHGVTFSTVSKLRTVLWAWEGEALSAEEIAGIERVRSALDGDLRHALRGLLHRAEVEATRARVADLLATRVFPSPNPDWPAIPWPPY